MAKHSLLQEYESIVFHLTAEVASVTQGAHERQ